MNEPPRRVGVTGAAGYIAGRLIEGLIGLESVERILATDVRPSSVSQSPKVEFLRQDVGDPFPDLFVGRELDAVVHLAYVLNPGHNRRAARRVNVRGTVNLLEACEKANVGHILYLSSTSVYGAHPDNPEFLSEDAPARPLKGFQYSEDKAEAEGLLAHFAARDSGATVTVLRACPVLGPHADNFISRAFSRSVLVRVSGDDPPMQFLHEDDLVEIMLRCLAGRPSGTYNLAGDGTIRWTEMAGLLGRRLLTMPAPVVYPLVALGWRLRLQREAPACGINFIRYPWTADTEKAKRELGVGFRYTSRQAWEAFAHGTETAVSTQRH